MRIRRRARRPCPCRRRTYRLYQKKRRSEGSFNPRTCRRCYNYNRQFRRRGEGLQRRSAYRSPHLKPTKKAPRRREALAGNFLYSGIARRRSCRAERGTRAAFSVLFCFRFAFRFNQPDILRKIENGGFDQLIQAVRIKRKAFFL